MPHPYVPLDTYAATVLIDFEDALWKNGMRAELHGIRDSLGQTYTLKLFSRPSRWTKAVWHWGLYADDGKTLVGAGRFDESDEPADSPRGPTYFQVKDVALTPAVQGRGVYQALLQFFRKRFGPIRSDYVVSEAAEKAWKRIGGEEFRPDKDSDSYLVLNPTERTLASTPPWAFGIALAGFVLALIFVANKASASAPAPKPAPEPQPLPPPKPEVPDINIPGTPETFVLVGDSLAVGLAPNLKTLLGSSYLGTEAKVGSFTSQWAPKISDILAKYKPTTLLVSLGTNDAYLPDPNVNKASVQKIVNDAVKAGVRLVWIAPPSLPATYYGKPVRDAAIRSAIDSTNVEQFNSLALTIPRGGDNLHPTPAGYKQWAAAIASYLGAS